jgi:hypothetical protein
LTLVLLAVAALAALRLYSLDKAQRQTAPKPKPRPQPASAIVGARRVNAQDYPGDDIGTKINNAAIALGKERGEIVLAGGGLFKVAATIPPGSTLLLQGGIFKAVTKGAFILLSDDAALVGDNWDAILEESTAPGTSGGLSPDSGRPVHTIVQDLAGYTTNGLPARGLRVEHVHFRGVRTDFQSAYQTVSLGNGKGIRATRNFFEFTRAIALQVGGSGALGHYAQDCILEDNRFLGVATQNIAVTNAVGVLVRNNSFERTGQPGAPGATCIDVEPNVGDRTENVIIQNNVIDCRESPADATGPKVLNAISINNGNGANPWRNIQVLDNQVLCNLKPGGGVAYVGILLRSSVGTVVAGNTLLRCVRGIMIDSDSALNRIERNVLRSCGSRGRILPWGGTAAIEIQDSSHGNIVRGNRLEAIPGDGLEAVAGRIWTVANNDIGENPGALER